MRNSLWRRMGAIFVIVVVLGVALAPVASAAPEQESTNAPAAGGCAPTYYLIRWGDNLTRIAWRYGVTIWQLQQWNGISNPNRIYAGRTLVIYPCGYPEPRPHPQPRPQPPAPPPHRPDPGQMCTEEFFDNAEVAGDPLFSHPETGIDYNWTGTSPAPDVIPEYYFSARWTRVSKESGTYRVTATADDGVRIWIDDVLIIDGWDIHAVETYVQDVMLHPGEHTWRVEYFQAEGEAVIKVQIQKTH